MFNRLLKNINNFFNNILINLRYILKRNIIIRIIVLRIKLYFNIIKPKELSILERLNFDTILDIGSNIGIWSYYLQKNSKKILAFEPLKEPIQICKLLCKKNVKIFNFALGDKNETKFLFIPKKDNPRSSFLNLNYDSHKKLVSLKKGDDFLKKNNNIDLIKIDVEGFELKVLLGIKKKIKKNHPLIIIEIVKKFNSKYLKVYSFLLKFGYQAYFMKNKKIIKIKNFKKFIKINQKTKFSGDENKNVYNFWFINSNWNNKLNNLYKN